MYRPRKLLTVLTLTTMLLTLGAIVLVVGILIFDAPIYPAASLAGGPYVKWYPPPNVSLKLSTDFATNSQSAQVSKWYNQQKYNCWVTDQYDNTPMCDYSTIQILDFFLS